MTTFNSGDRAIVKRSSHSILIGATGTITKVDGSRVHIRFDDRGLAEYESIYGRRMGMTLVEKLPDPQNEVEREAMVYIRNEFGATGSWRP